MKTTPRTFFPRAMLCLWVTILAFALAVATTPVPAAYAVSSVEKQAEADAVWKSVDAMQTELNQVNEDYNKATEDQQAAEAAMIEAQGRINEAEKRIDELQGRLGNRVTNMYKEGNTTFLDVLLGANTFEEFLTTFDMLTRINAQDASLVQETKDVREELQAARDEFEAQKIKAEEEMQKASDLKVQIEATQAALRAEAEKLSAEALELKAKEELEAEEARLAAEAAAAAQQQYFGGPSGSAGSSVVSGNGQFSHPCPSGSISSNFGYRSFDNAFHKGTDFAAPEGTPIYAADSGTVMYATYGGGYNGGAGNWVVITHGNGLTTTYMHCSAVYVSPGQGVERGQNIAAVGNTGNSFGAHLHFQVEISGTAVNPLLYL